MTWARRLKRVVDLDPERCDQCGGKLKIIAAIEEPAVVERILTHPGLAAAAARADAACRSVAGGLIRKPRTVL